MSNDVNATQPLFIILNAKSGSEDTAEVVRRIEDKLEKAGRDFAIELIEDPRRLPEIARKTADRARAAGGIIVASGGDGAINCIIQHAKDSGCVLGLLPQGTFNLFARTHKVPEDLDAALDVLLTGYVEPVQLGAVNDQIFLVNASLGLYPKVLEDREWFKQQYGRSRRTAFFAGFFSLLQGSRTMRLDLEKGSEFSQLSAYTLFIGNNELQLEQIGIEGAEKVTAGKLGAILLPPVSRLEMLRLMWNGALRRLDEDEKIVTFFFREMTVHRSGRRRRSVKVAMDGEIFRMSFPLSIRAADTPVRLIKPDPHRETPDPPIS